MRTRAGSGTEASKVDIKLRHLSGIVSRQSLRFEGPGGFRGHST